LIAMSDFPTAVATNDGITDCPDTHNVDRV